MTTSVVLILTQHVDFIETGSLPSYQEWDRENNASDICQVEENGKNIQYRMDHEETTMDVWFSPVKRTKKEMEFSTVKFLTSSKYAHSPDLSDSTGNCGRTDPHFEHTIKTEKK